jgi:hypothetical protein
VLTGEPVQGYYQGISEQNMQLMEQQQRGQLQWYPAYGEEKESDKRMMIEVCHENTDLKKLLMEFVEAFERASAKSTAWDGNRLLLIRAKEMLKKRR